MTVSLLSSIDASVTSDQFHKIPQLDQLIRSEYNRALAGLPDANPAEQYSSTNITYIGTSENKIPIIAVDFGFYGLSAESASQHGSFQQVRMYLGLRLDEGGAAHEADFTPRTDFGVSLLGLGLRVVPAPTKIHSFLVGIECNEDHLDTAGNPWFGHGQSQVVINGDFQGISRDDWAGYLVGNPSYSTVNNHLAHLE